MPLEVVTQAGEVCQRAQKHRRDGRKIALVPTMGFLHDGHVSLLHEGRRRADVLVLSIFVNPTQFGPNEDLDRYPRDLPGDLDKARAAGVDLVFAPAAAAMYAPGYQSFVQVRAAQKGLCGDKRPDHFDGVASVVTKLFHITQPDVAIFGQKDYQQLVVIQTMVRDLNFAIEIVGMPIVREPDGLAMSSRNAYLSPEERRQALVLHQGLVASEQAVGAGETRAQNLVACVRDVVASAPLARIEYIEIRDAVSLAPVDVLTAPVVCALAVFVGKTRLIDNRVLTGLS